MQTPHEYRAQAEICLYKAEAAKTPKHRLILLDMAQTWLRMAEEADVINKRALGDGQGAETGPFPNSPVSSPRAGANSN